MGGPRSWISRPWPRGLEWSYGWEPAAQRLRFVLDFTYATGLRASELVGATLGMIEVDAASDHWLNVVGKGSNPGKVALPPLARAALDWYLVQRRLPTTPMRWGAGDTAARQPRAGCQLGHHRRIAYGPYPLVNIIYVVDCTFIQLAPLRRRVTTRQCEGLARKDAPGAMERR